MNTRDLKVGRKVRCVDGVFKEDPLLPFKLYEITVPKKGSLYTVREVEKGDVGGDGVRLQEIKNKKFSFSRAGLKEPIFAIARFELV